MLINLVSNSLIFLGVCLLAAALFVVRRLIVHLPAGEVRRSWTILTGLILLFLAGYLGYAVSQWPGSQDPEGLIVPVIFFFGAVFVLVVNHLSYRTTLDMRRIAALESENVTDPLTGIYNRRYLERQLTEEICQAHVHVLPLAILLLDIDHFKQVNDAYGHRIGDQVLIRMARLVSSSIHYSDIVARYGGDELVVIAPNTPPEAAAALAERLRQAVESAPMALPEGSSDDHERGVHITVSIGVAVLQPDHCDIDTLFVKADEALYQAKRDGRNRVAIRAGVESSIG
jgi:diguanylate cyclase (GGDEF)-like protein